MCILYAENRGRGIAHSISKLTTYLRFVSKYKGLVIIPDIIHNNIFGLIKGIFDSNFKILQKK